jgi:hypothetical protein
MTTTGDTIYSSSGSTPARLGIGTAGQVLQVNSGATAPEWATPVSGSTFSGASVYGTSNQTISNGTQTALTFNAENYDTNTYHDNSTNNTRLTVPSGKTGYYRLTAYCRWDVNTTGRRIIYLIKNGSVYAGQTEANPNQTGCEITNYVSQTLYLTAADYITMEMYQSSGGNATVSKDATVGTYFQIDYLGA